MKKSLILISLLVGAISFNGCGSDGGGSGGNGDASITPVTTKIVCDPKSNSVSSSLYDVKYAADGDITVLCKQAGQYSYGEYALVSGINQLTITDLKKVVDNYGDTTKLLGSSVDTYDYKAGTVHRKENVSFNNGKTANYDCTETFPSPLPITLTNKNSIENLLEWDGDEDELIKTTCPQSYYEEEYDSEDNNIGKGTINMITNYTLTDSDGKKHLITVSGKMTFK